MLSNRENMPWKTQLLPRHTGKSAEPTLTSKKWRERKEKVEYDTTVFPWQTLMQFLSEA